MADQAMSTAGRSPHAPTPPAPAAQESAAEPADGAKASAADSTSGAPNATEPADGTQAPGADARGAQATAEAEPAAGVDTATAPKSPGFGDRGRLRRRLRFLRKARELAYRDLGGLVFEMHRLGERHDELAATKLATLGAIDTELRALEDALGDSRPVTVLREAGIAACPRCAAIHGSEDRFCPACGTPMGRRADRPIASAPAPAASGPVVATALAAGSATTAPAAAPAATASPAAGAAPAPAAAPTTPPTASAPKDPGPISSGAAPAPASPAPTTPPTPRPASAKPSPPSYETPKTSSADDRPTEILRPSDSASRPEAKRDGDDRG